LPTAPSPTPEASATDLQRVITGKTAPDFTLEAMDGETVKLSNYRGQKFVVLVFYRGYF
jgi:peroxiredoxin